MTHNTLTIVEGVLRCEDLEAMLLATAGLRIRLYTIPEEEDWDDDYDQEYENYLDYIDYIEQRRD